jgi:PKD repeat protein
MEFELEDHIQPYISSNDAGIPGNALEFSGLNSNLPGFTAEAYYWDFGDGHYDTLADTRHIFSEPGVYGVKLGVKGSMEGSDLSEIRCVVKPVTIVADSSKLNTGSYENKMDISPKKATSVVNDPAENGLDRARPVGKDYGESRPVGNKETKEGGMPNRRVGFNILKE